MKILPNFSSPRDEYGAADDKIGNLSPFSKESPNTWFTMAELEFRIFRINQQGAKYNYVVAAIDLETAYEVIDIIFHRKIHREIIPTTTWKRK